MTDDQLERVKELLEALSNSDTPGATSLEGEDPIVRQEVNRLHRLQLEKGGFLDTPAIFANSAEEPRDLLGLVLDSRFLLKHVLGEGGFGTAFLAHDKRLNRKVVVKILHRGVLSEESSSKELEALARIDHPGVVGILDAGRTPDGKSYLVTRYLQGPTLRKVLNEQGTVNVTDLRRIGAQLVDAVAFAHRRGVLHLDIKPDNIVLEDFGDGETRAVILDFGVARLRHLLEPRSKLVQFGTSSYCAPELAAGEEPDRSSDLYSIAVILHEMLVGNTAFKADVRLPKELESVLPQSARCFFASAIQIC